MTDSFDIKQVISKSTSDVALSDLAKKGFKKVKVLDKGTINRLIEEAVARVVHDQLQRVSASERAQIEQEAKVEFDRLFQERQRELREAQALRDRLATVENELAQRNAEVARLAQQAPAPDLGELVKGALRDLQGEAGGGSANDIGALKASIQELTDRLARGGGQLAASRSDEVSSEAIEGLFAKMTDVQVDSNLDKVKAKNAKAGGVSQSLNKLKSLQRGDGHGG